MIEKTSFNYIVQVSTGDLFASVEICEIAAYAWLLRHVGETRINAWEESLELAFFDRLGCSPLLQKIPNRYYGELMNLLPKLYETTERLERIVATPDRHARRGFANVVDDDLRLFLEVCNAN